MPQFFGEARKSPAWILPWLDACFWSLGAWAGGTERHAGSNSSVNVGYRWFDQEKIDPLFAFGHGLSYTSFAYSGLKVEKAKDGGLDVMVTIKNTGTVASDEVPQVYLGAPSET